MNDKTSSPLIIYADGVVVSDDTENASILSVRENDVVFKKDVNISTFNSVWGYWYPNAYQEVRLNLNISNRNVIEGDINYQPQFFNMINKMVKRQRSSSGELGIFLFHFRAAHVHLRNLLREYARLTSIIGPKLDFDDVHFVYSLNYPECYAHFDSCLTSLRSFADSTRFVIWKLLARSQGLPRNLRSLVTSYLPNELVIIIKKYLETSISKLSEYRDNTIHYAPPGTHMSPWLLWSHNVIHAQVWLPNNPGVRSLKKFKYLQKDAYLYAKILLEQSYAFCDELFPVLDELQREVLRNKRNNKKMQKERE